MTAELGAFALVLALALSLAQVALSAAGRARNHAGLRGAGEGAALGAFLAVATAFACLTIAYVTSDFSVLNVAENSHSEKPLLYKFAGVWGNHEGSMLLWCLALTGFGAAVALLGRDLPARLKAAAVATQGGLGALFLAYTAFASSPFLRLPLKGGQRWLAQTLDPHSAYLQFPGPPVEGSSLNPLLQDPALAIHPPMLYCGYVGFSIVFSFAVAALIEGRVDAAWARWVRPWTLAAWSFLTVGITLGAFWAYYELGWGGWWFWDPVENASFMPWLVGTALLHSAIVTEKRGALPGWTVFLALAAFTFAMLGAFLVRSGVLTSVHAFAVDPARGNLLLMIMALASGFGFTLFAWRAPSLAKGGLFAPVSRETTLVVNNLFLSAATLAVLLGTLYPLVLEAIIGKPNSVGTPYFNMVFAPLMGIALVLLPAGPLIAWKRGEALGALQRLWWAAVAAGAAAIAGYAVVSPGRTLAAFGCGLGVWLILGTLIELAERTRFLRAPGPEVWRRFTGLPRGAFGMSLAHFGLGVFCLGACIELAGKAEQAKVMTPGDQMSVGAYIFRLDSVGDVDGPNYEAERAQITVTRAKDGSAVCTARPERRFYPAGGQSTSEVALCLRGLDDVYVVLDERRPGPAWRVSAYHNPWVRLIFLGPLFMALGGVVSLSDRRLRLGVGRKAKTA